ncbi:YqaJ viral recombinase family protein [Azomonas macrocytogenes]|uniref:Putative phage-type endonuclease n=1 Tax=Azomonas macrocytogenes TaxID=69962 RepID=A0A839TC27_AZOMA|nr:YqaJ viral recombinase family protein [Azomonas macrocytogenes]MBB3105153.1 putative phage-type endonuclease [Azomonas macrocytogenes]
MKIVNLEQGSEQWLAWRAQGITATDAAILLGRSKYKTRWRLWAEKTGYAREVDLSLNPLVRQGREGEDLARQIFEDYLGDLLLPVCIESTVDPLIRASLDGITTQREPVELKCPSEKVWKAVCSDGANSEAFQLYYPQVQHQLLATGSRNGYLVFYFEGDIRHFKIEPDKALLRELYAQAQQFWQQVVNKQEPVKDPDLDLYLPKGEDAQAWIYTAEQYRLFHADIQACKNRLKELEELQKTHLETLKTLMGEYLHADYCGVMVTRYKTAGKVDYARLLEEVGQHITPTDVEQYRAKSSERCRVTVSTESVMPRHVVEPAVIAPLEDVPVVFEQNYF